MIRKIRFVTVGAMAALAACAMTPASLAQTVRGVGTPAVRLELRIVPQRGLPGDAAGVVDLAGTAHDDIVANGQVRRFEVQYRLIDNITTDMIIPVGLRSAIVSIAAVGPGQGGSGGGRLRRAVLSRFEAELAAGTPPASPDLSGATSPLTYTGLHRPFRDQIAAPPPNNEAPANGVVQALAPEITNILPLSSVTNGQSVVDAWYGLYSFDLQAIGVLPGVIALTATPQTDGATGNRFTYWNQNDANPRLSPAATGGSATVLSTIPSPASGMVSVVVLGFAARRRRAPSEATG